MSRERRRYERIPVTGQLRVELIGYDWSLTLVNVSVGGFGVTSEARLPAAGRLEFRFSTADGEWSTVLLARASYFLPEPTHDGPTPVYRIGFAFEHAYKLEVRREIEALMARVDAVTTV
jgi:hypothetical protein